MFFFILRNLLYINEKWFHIKSRMVRVMLAVITSTLAYLFFVLLGIVCMFIDYDAFYFIPFFFLFLYLLTFFYRTPNCKSLEKKDFIATFIFVLINISIYFFLQKEMKVGTIAYFYLIAFICIEMFVNSIRFKSLL